MECAHRVLNWSKKKKGGLGSNALKVRLCFDNTLFECARNTHTNARAHILVHTYIHCVFKKGVVLPYKVDRTRKSDRVRRYNNDYYCFS